MCERERECVCLCDFSTFISRILISGNITPGSTSWKCISVLPVKEAVRVFCVSEKPLGALIPPRKAPNSSVGMQGLLRRWVHASSLLCSSS